ncbi:MAG TPA: hypothetical protein PKC72_05555, partial [Chitinophagaceae bacterium]|nr:hypothetical protein [Chitinophagaceae bacterium]
MNGGLVITVLSGLILMNSCSQNKKKNVEKINTCYNDHLTILQRDSEYKNLYKEFENSFPILIKANKELQFTENKIDSAVFFNKGKTKCILIILQKISIDISFFGFGRTVVGTKNNLGSWSFELDTEYMFGEDWFDLFEE